MALTTCPDCQRQISTEASTCPGCGRPMKVTQAATIQQQPIAVVVEPSKSPGVYIILGLLLGLLGIHNFYAGYYGRGAVQLAITALLGWIYIGIFITGIWVLIELFSVEDDANGVRMT
jgi:TM2 domain-containing membrane protein YozV